MKPAMRLEIAKLQDMSVDQSKLGKLGAETWGHPQTLAAGNLGPPTNFSSGSDPLLPQDDTSDAHE